MMGNVSGEEGTGSRLGLLCLYRCLVWGFLGPLVIFWGYYVVFAVIRKRQLDAERQAGLPGGYVEIH